MVHTFLMRPFVAFSSVRVTTRTTSPLIYSNLSLVSRSCNGILQPTLASPPPPPPPPPPVKNIHFHHFSSSRPRFEGLHGVRRRFSVQATTQVSDSGSIDSPMMQSMQKKIKEQLNADEVIVKDAYGDGRHVSIDVISSSFEGQSSVNRQRMVYKAIWEELQSTVHAVDQMTTRTPEEAAENR